MSNLKTFYMKLSNRYQSLDVFRGMDVALMIIVNAMASAQDYGLKVVNQVSNQASQSESIFESVWSPFQHADWDGFTLTDFVFPTFLFVVGSSMFFSLSRYEGMGNAVVMGKVVKRSAIIFLIGYLMYWFPFFNFNSNGELVFRTISETRILGVLQRIALCYGIAAVIIHFGKTKAAIIYSILALVFYSAILLLNGDLTMEGNFGTWLDRTVLGEAHMYHGEGIAFDPEGILSTIPSVVNVLAGYLAASLISRKGSGYETIARMMVVGALLLLAAQWLNLMLPINKKLWSSSYVLHTIGLDLLALPVVMYIIEIAGIRKWTPFFEVFGKNTLFIYLFAEIMVILMYWYPTEEGSLYQTIYSAIYKPLGDNIGSLFFGLSVMLTCWTLGKILDKRGIYIKV